LDTSDPIRWADCMVGAERSYEEVVGAGSALGVLSKDSALGEDVTPMGKSDNVGEFEQLILAALLMLGDNAYGMTVHEQVEKLTAGVRSVSLGSVYTTLDQLEQRGYVKSCFSDPTPERGGRSKRYFEITGAGEKTLKSSAKVAANIVAGLREIGAVV
jgi:PadR family transcriptional regulator PadR